MEVDTKQLNYNRRGEKMGEETAKLDRIVRFLQKYNEPKSRFHQSILEPLRCTKRQHKSHVNTN